MNKRTNINGSGGEEDNGQSAVENPFLKELPLDVSLESIVLHRTIGFEFDSEAKRVEVFGSCEARKIFGHIDRRFVFFDLGGVFDSDREVSIRHFEPTKDAKSADLFKFNDKKLEDLSFDLAEIIKLAEERPELFPRKVLTLFLMEKDPARIKGENDRFFVVGIQRYLDISQIDPLAKHNSDSDNKLAMFVRRLLDPFVFAWSEKPMVSLRVIIPR